LKKSNTKATAVNSDYLGQYLSCPTHPEAKVLLNETNRPRLNLKQWTPLNCINIVPVVAPSALRVPISRVRSVTEKPNMIFIDPDTTNQKLLQHSSNKI